MDRVFIKGLSLRGKHGVYKHERIAEQNFMLDISADVDVSAAGKSDSLDDTVDYVRFSDIAKDVVENNSYYLVEKLAEVIAGRILEDVRIHSVSVSILKPQALDNGIPGVSIVRTRV